MARRLVRAADILKFLTRLLSKHIVILLKRLYSY